LAEQSNKLWLSLGIIAPSLFLVLYSIAMASDPGYTFGKNYLSDLGVGPGAWAFKSALVITGFLLVLFSIMGVRPLLGSATISKVAVAFLAVDGVLLACIGIFTEDFDPEHYIFSVAFFLTFLLTLVLMTLALWKTKVLGTSGYAFSAVMVVIGLILLPMGGDPFSETVAVFSIVVWGMGISVSALLKESGRRIP
jgi:hypothetical membrane protein